MKKKFTQLFAYSLFAVTLTGCATSGPTAYGPVSETSSYGSEFQKIEHDRFRVTYTAKSEAEAHDFALLSAAELAKTEGFSHFKILGGDQRNNNRPGSSISTSIGFSTGRHYGSGVGVGINIHDVVRSLESSKSVQILDVRLLRQTSANAGDIFNAEEVIQNIRPEVFK